MQKRCSHAMIAFYHRIAATRMNFRENKTTWQEHTGGEVSATDLAKPSNSDSGLWRTKPVKKPHVFCY